MKTFVLWMLFGAWGCLFVRGETTPADQPLQDEKETVIACELSKAPKHGEVPVFAGKDGEAAMGTYHYKLWLPKGYHDDVKQSWPCMFIASPSGNANMGHMAPWLKANGYVVVMLVESKNGDWPPIVGNFLAAHDDVVKRVRILDGLKFATGQSGGARASSVFAQIRPGFAGLVLQSAGAASDATGAYAVTKLKGGRAPFVAMTMGETDKNKPEVQRMKTAIGSTHFDAFPFDGGHDWAPQDVFEKAMSWLELQVYRQKDSSPAVKKILQPRCGKAGK